MKLQIISMFDEDSYRSFQKLIKDGKTIYSVRDLSDCPEDAIIGRDLFGCDQLISLLRQFQGEEIPEKIEKINVETWDEYDSYGS